MIGKYVEKNPQNVENFLSYRKANHVGFGIFKKD